MKLPAIRVTAQLVSPNEQHLDAEFHILVESSGLPASIVFSQRVTDITLMTKGLFQVVWGIMGKAIQNEIERSVDEYNSRSTTGG